MAIIKCKMCGGDLNLIEGASTAECEFCGSVQTIPNLDDEKKLVQFERAERLRKQCEFDKAAGIYETIVADFRQEAEAYWGLVLCKYGIEYVDDPATGKKIPTCHRSSFDSIMEDSDFEQALENADGTARKVYRDEAKAIEEIRKGIIAVSNNEKPYDIFICYKETDENGDRTLDSVLAQDVYDALTGKGYRVFFSRITLEDKLGMEYEPYIFAALNSAKIMLAFGTDYEYFNAVWVKNEWSRFLKLMAKDKEKHLIPCFKGIDAYDMPKEFARLQAQDLGKVGAIQDLLRGIEKIIPRQTAQPVVVQERVVVGGSGDNKIASLLDRGNMALEDGDWAKADSFFEDVLNNDSKNAQAYLGKTLATEKCRTIDAFARKRKDASQNVRGETLELQPNRAHVDEMAKQFSLSGYVEQSEICKLYDFDLSYHSDVADRKQQYRSEEKYWIDHKWLSKAEKFAVGAVAEHLETEKKALFAALADRVKKAEATEATAKQNVQTRYEAHLRLADEQAEKLYSEGLAHREKYYKELLQIAKTSSDVEELTETAEKFDSLGGYQDSKNLAEHCRKRAAEEKAKLDTEAERQRIEAARLVRERKKKAKRTAIIAAVAAAIVAVAILIITTVVIPTNNYKKAETLLASGDREGAITFFAKAGSYSDADQRRTELEMEAINYATVGDSVLYGTYKNEAISWQVIDEQEGSLLLISTYGLDLVPFSKETASWGNSNLNAWLNGTFKNRAFCSEEYANIKEMEPSRIFILGAEQIKHYFPNEEDRAIEFTNYCASKLNSAMEDNRWWWAGTYSSSDTFPMVEYVGTDGSISECVSDHSYVAVRPVIWVNKDADRIAEMKAEADALFAAGDLDSAAELYSSLSDDNALDQIAVAKAELLVSEGKIGAAAIAYAKINDNAEAMQRSYALWDQLYGQTVAIGRPHIVALKNDGTVVASGVTKYGNCDVSEWKNIVQVAAANAQTFAVTEERRVLATGLNENGRCDVSGWENIAAVFAGDFHTVGLKVDGTVVATGLNDDKQCKVSDWADIIQIDLSDNHTVGLKADGTVVATGDNEFGQCDVSNWTDIVKICASENYTVGMKADGTVVATGNNDIGSCNVTDWSGVVDISANAGHTLALREDGTVLATGNNDFGELDVGSWQNITKICAMNGRAVGLRNDGTVLSIGNSSKGECNTADWKNIVTFSCGVFGTAGVQADGTLVLVGDFLVNECNCNVSLFTDIKLPD